MFGAIANGITNFANQVVGYNYNRDKRAWLEKQQRLAQYYNLNLAKQQNTWNIQQWNRENAYNTPFQQRQRYAQAGMNPDLVYSQGNLASQSPLLTSGAPTSPLGSDAYGEFSSWSNIVNESLQGMETAARIKNINADTENKEADTDKKGEETKGLSIDNVYKAIHHEKELEVADTVIALNIANKDFTKKDTERLQTEISRLGEEVQNLRQARLESQAKVDEYRQRIASMKNDDKLKMLDYFLKEKQVQAQIRLIAAQADVTVQQAQVFMERHINEMFNLRADTNVKHSQVDLNVQQYRSLEKYGDELMQATVQAQQGQARINISNANLAEAVNGTKTCCDLAVALTTGCNLFSGFIGGILGKL